MHIIFHQPKITSQRSTGHISLVLKPSGNMTISGVTFSQRGNMLRTVGQCNECLSWAMSPNNAADKTG